MIVRAHRKFPAAFAIGGKVEPIWETKKPSWLPPKMEDYLAILDFGKLPLKNPPWLVSANLSFKRKTFEIFGNFNESLGRKKGSFMFKDEIEFLERIKKEEGEILYLPSIKVKHFISKKRTSLRFLFRRVFWEGRSETKIDRIMGNSLVKNGLGLIKEFLPDMLRMFLGLVRRDGKKVVGFLIPLIFILGYLYGIVLPLED